MVMKHITREQFRIRILARFALLSMASKTFPDLEDGLLVIPPQMKHGEVIQYIKTYKDTIRHIIISDRTEGLKKIFKELEHCTVLEHIEMKQCGIAEKQELMTLFKAVFDKCPNLRNVTNVQSIRETKGLKNYKTVIKRKGSTIIEIGYQSESGK